MEVDFANTELEDMWAQIGSHGGFAQAVLKLYRRRIQFIRAATDERDFYAMKSLHYEKLKGDGSHQNSMRLNKQWRLIVEIIPGTPKNTVLVVGIKDYH